MFRICLITMLFAQIGFGKTFTFKRRRSHLLTQQIIKQCAKADSIAEVTIQRQGDIEIENDNIYPVGRGLYLVEKIECLRGKCPNIRGKELKKLDAQINDDTYIPNNRLYLLEFGPRKDWYYGPKPLDRAIYTQQCTSPTKRTLARRIWRRCQKNSDCALVRVQCEIHGKSNLNPVAAANRKYVIEFSRWLHSNFSPREIQSQCEEGTRQPLTRCIQSRCMIIPVDQIGSP